MSGPRREPEREEVAKFLSRGDEASFRLLYRRHTPFLYALALRWTDGRGSDADDLVQETWIRAVAGLRRFRWESRFSTWLCGIAIRCARELARGGAAADRLESPQVVTTTAAPDEQIDLERAVASLPPGYREVLLLHDVHGYTHDEIAGLLSIDAGTSKSQLSRARRAARQRLHASHGDEQESSR